MSFKIKIPKWFDEVMDLKQHTEAFNLERNRKYFENFMTTNDLQTFFKELKDFYSKNNQEFIWTWEQIEEKNHNVWNSKSNVVQDFIYYIAYNLSKNILHGPLPAHLHSRMMFESNNWTKKYIQYLEGK